MGYLNTRSALLLAVIAVAAFHLAYQVDRAAGLIFVYLAAMFSLAWVGSTRIAFYLGLAIGFAIAAPQLFFMFGIFGPMAISLWLIFGLWIAFYLLLARMVVERWPRYGALWIPVLWLGLEFFRSELYYLKFAWLIPGFALASPSLLPAAELGVYGFSFLVLAIFVVMRSRLGRISWPVVGALALLPAIFPLQSSSTGGEPAGPLVVGIQLEGADAEAKLAALEAALADHPDAELFVLSEYSFPGPIPAWARQWCRQRQKYLIAGGMDEIDGGPQYYNTAFVVAPSGEIVFRQAKSVPIQFFRDGLPAASQGVWESPWGKIGIAICYDLS